MDKIWKYLSAFLTGALLMAIIAMKWIAGDDYSVEIKKIKNKRSSGDNVITTPIIIKPKKESRKERRKKRKMTKI